MHDAGIIHRDLYDVSADGERFVRVRNVKEGSTLPMLILVQNWFAEFKNDNR